MANDIDEPRLRLARLLRLARRSLAKPARRRRDGRGRWLWRLVSRIFLPELKQLEIAYTGSGFIPNHDDTLRQLAILLRRNFARHGLASG